MVERLQKYFSKYKPKESRLARQPRMVDYVLNNEERTLVINADDWFGYQEFTPEVTENIYKKIKGELPKVYRDYQVTVKTLGMTIDELIPNRLSRNADKSRLWGDIDYDGEPWVKNISKPYKTTRTPEPSPVTMGESRALFRPEKA